MKIFVAEDKYGPKYYRATPENALIILEDNKDAGYYDKDDIIEVISILQTKDGKAAIDYLESRASYEYEYFSIEECYE